MSKKTIFSLFTLTIFLSMPSFSQSPDTALEFLENLGEEGGTSSQRDNNKSGFRPICIRTFGA